MADGVITFLGFLGKDFDHRICQLSVLHPCAYEANWGALRLDIALGGASILIKMRCVMK